VSDDNRDQEKLALLKSAKASFRADQRARTWEERVAAIARMNAASKLAREGMRATMAHDRKQPR
jgi:hypothetical protein